MSRELAKKPKFLINIISDELNKYNTNISNTISKILELESEIKNKINNYFILQNKFILHDKQIIYTTENDIINSINTIFYNINLKILELYNLKMNNQLNYKERLESSKIMEKLNKISLCNNCSECITYNDSIEELHILNIDNFINVYFGRINAFINYCNKSKLKDNRQKLLDTLNNDINITDFIANFIRYKCHKCSDIEKNIKNNNIENNNIKNKNYYDNNENTLKNILKNNFC